MKGIILAGGTGSRLFPATQVVNKQLLPVYDKPMIFYPLSVLMMANIREILLITTPGMIPMFQRLLGDGTGIGLNIKFLEQPMPNGLAEAFIIGREFIGDDDCALILGDNIFYGHGFTDLLKKASIRKGKATIFTYWVSNPNAYGVAYLDSEGKAIDLVEKPSNSTSNWAITGLYFFDNRVIDFAANVKPSQRNELEIIDILRTYMETDTLNVQPLGRGFAWLDTGSHDTLLQASHFVQTIEQRQGQKIACLEEIALRMKFIDFHDFQILAGNMSGTVYGQYLIEIGKDFQNDKLS